MTVFGILRLRENVADRYGLADGAEMHFQAYSDRKGGHHVLITCGTADDHVSRVLAVPADVAGGPPRVVQDWIDEQLQLAVDEYREPWRRFRHGALAELEQAIAAGAVVWPQD